ncbi:MAG: hypothetical protein Q9M97_08455 [Candidatus Gracilibacteria bacterium]|nr:hypothetical protein [Candidatus Gracilibacteria bacterium]
MSDALELYRTTKDLPIPDDKVDVKTDTTTIAYQGYIGKNVLETIEYTESGLDPKDKNYFSYYLTRNKKYFQLLAFLEEPSEDIAVGVNTRFTPTNATDYTDRYPYTKGKKLGILTDINNAPIQELPEISNLNGNTGSGYLNISDVADLELKSILKDSDYVSGTGTVFSQLWKVADKGGKGYFVIENLYIPQLRDGTLKCSTGFILVPGNQDWDTYDFCVAQYEMSWEGLIDIDNGLWAIYSYSDNGDKGKIVSEAGNSPIAEITQLEAILECKEIGGYLINNNQWMTIVRNIEKEKSNWSSGIVGDGFIYNGVSGNLHGCIGGINKTLFTGSECDGGKNKLKLSNGKYIYDLAGNIEEHVNKANTIGGSLYGDGINPDISAGSTGNYEWDSSDITNINRALYGPSLGINSSNGIGKIRQAEGHIFIRGGTASLDYIAGIFSLNLMYYYNSSSHYIGFRCISF